MQVGTEVPDEGEEMIMEETEGSLVSEILVEEHLCGRAAPK